jgi:3-methyladenine DNA glycosylase AlkD
VAVRDVAGDIEAGLRAIGDPDRALSARAYLKSDLEFLGVSVPALRHTITTFSRSRPDLAHRDVIALVRALWARPVFECRLAAVELLRLHVGALQAGDWSLLEKLIREARTWALVDELAVAVVGGLIERDPVLVTGLDGWAQDENFWVRRSALLALLTPLKRGGGDFERFSRYADAMLDEREFFVAKAIGWVLRETAKRRPELVAGWLLVRAPRVAGVAWREAVKPLTTEQRVRVEAARSANGRPSSRRPARGGPDVMG